MKRLALVVVRGARLVGALAGVSALVMACSSGPGTTEVPKGPSGAASGSSAPLAKPATAEVELTPEQMKRSCECTIWSFERGGEKLPPEEREATCKNDEPNVDCVLTFGPLSDCQALVECSRGEPSRIPTCREGYQLHAMNMCYKKCDADPKSCPPKTACDPDEKLCRPS